MLLDLRAGSVELLTAPQELRIALGLEPALGGQRDRLQVVAAPVVVGLENRLDQTIVSELVPVVLAPLDRANEVRVPQPVDGLVGQTLGRGLAPPNQAAGPGFGDHVGLVEPVAQHVLAQVDVADDPFEGSRVELAQALVDVAVLLDVVALDDPNPIPVVCFFVVELPPELVTDDLEVQRLDVLTRRGAGGGARPSRAAEEVLDQLLGHPGRELAAAVGRRSAHRLERPVLLQALQTVARQEPARQQAGVRRELGDVLLAHREEHVQVAALVESFLQLLEERLALPPALDIVGEQLFELVEDEKCGGPAVTVAVVQHFGEPVLEIQRPQVGVRGILRQRRQGEIDEDIGQRSDVFDGLALRVERLAAEPNRPQIAHPLLLPPPLALSHPPFPGERGKQAGVDQRGLARSRGRVEEACLPRLGEPHEDDGLPAAAVEGLALLLVLFEPERPRARKRVGLAHLSSPVGAQPPKRS